MGSRSMSVTQAEVFHHCPFNDQLEEAGEKREQRREEDLPRKATSRSAFIGCWDFVGLKGLKMRMGSKTLYASVGQA